MAHEIETAMYVGKPAWHGLGKLLDKPPTVTEAIRLAGLDWTVSKVPVYLGAPDGRQVPDSFAIVRDSDKAILGNNVGRIFQALQNERAFQWFQSFLDAGLATIEAAGSLRGGKRVWILAKLVGDDAVIVPKADDRVTKYLLLGHGHDGSLQIHIGVTPTRVVCANTLSAAIGEGGCLKIRHTSGADASMLAAKEVVERANRQFDKAAEVYRQLAAVDVRSSAQIREYIDVVFPAPKKPAMAPAVAGADFAALLSRPMGAKTVSVFADGENTTKETRARIYGEIETLFQRGRGNDMPGVKGTAWAAYNAVTEYITHERGRNADNRVNTAWFGPESARAIQGAQSVFLAS